jgi:hypothetical protein
VPHLVDGHEDHVAGDRELLDRPASIVFCQNSIQIRQRRVGAVSPRPSEVLLLVEAPPRHRPPSDGS